MTQSPNLKPQTAKQVGGQLIAVGKDDTGANKTATLTSFGNPEFCDPIPEPLAANISHFAENIYFGRAGWRAADSSGQGRQGRGQELPQPPGHVGRQHGVYTLLLLYYSHA